MSIIRPDVYSYKDTQNIQVYGEALLSYGLEVRDGINGYGLVTRGFLWETQAIWLDIEFAAPLATSWSNSDAMISTAWTTSAGGIFGDYSN